jgi:hypothetical protein
MLLFLDDVERVVQIIHRDLNYFGVPEVVREDREEHQPIATG